MALHYIGNVETLDRNQVRAPLNGDYSVKVNTTDCDSVNMGSIPISYPRLTDKPILGIIVC